VGHGAQKGLAGGQAVTGLVVFTQQIGNAFRLFLCVFQQCDAHWRLKLFTTKDRTAMLTIQ